ncbi:hypothetical protein Tco_0103377 [Tanacetum coccineum]
MIISHQFTTTFYSPSSSIPQLEYPPLETTILNFPNKNQVKYSSNPKAAALQGLILQEQVETILENKERYKEQVKVLKEGQNVDLKSQDNVSESCAQSVEIDHLKRTISEHLKEKESLLQTVTHLKNDFKKEESRNPDRKIALEKQIKHLDNIVFKRDQSAQTVYMLTKPQFFYDNTTKQALGFQNPFYLKKAQQLEPMLYVGDIIQKTNPIVIPDSEETLTLAEESRLKMLLKHKDNMMQEKIKQIDTTPIDYAALNKLYKDFETRFVPQTELSAEQAFWSHNSVSSSEPDLSDRPTNVEVPKELPKVSMAVEQHRVESSLNKNERLLEQVMSKDIVNLIVNSSIDFASVNVHECEKCLKLETELQKDFGQFYFKSKAPSFDQLFELNELKAQSQEKDMVIKKFKERIKSLSRNMDKDKIKQDLEEIETINIEMDHRVTKIIAKNEHLKQT